MDDVASQGVAFEFGTLGGRFATDAVADGVDIFAGSFKEFITKDAGGFVFYLGVLEAEIEVGLATGSEDDTVDADHFLGAFVVEDDAFAEAVFLEGDDFAGWEDGHAELFGKIAE